MVESRTKTFVLVRDKLADLPRIDDAAVVELADTQHSKCCERKLVSVRLRPAASLVRGASRQRRDGRKAMGVRLSLSAPKNYN